MTERLDLRNLPDDPLDRRGEILCFAARNVIPQTIQFMRNEYAQASLLKNCVHFVSNDLLEASPSDLDSLNKVWFFPWAEACRELDQVQTACMLAMYKAAHGHLRRGLELVFLGIYFTLDETPTENARAWVTSMHTTPQFKKIIERLLQYPQFSRLETMCHWSEQIKKIYWTLSDVVHVRGENCGFINRQPLRSNYGSVWIPEFDSNSLAQFLDIFILVVRHIATALAAAYPRLLVELDMELKFGLNGPVSGFFSEEQAMLLRKLSLDDARSVLDDIVATDPEVQDLLRWYESIPDITSEEIGKQAEHFQSQWPSSTQGPPHPDDRLNDR